MLVVYIGTMALLQNGEVKPLDLSAGMCEAKSICYLSNSTTTEDITQENNDDTS